MNFSGDGLNLLVRMDITTTGIGRRFLSLGKIAPTEYKQSVILTSRSRQVLGDKNAFLVNTTGWVTFEDVCSTRINHIARNSTHPFSCLWIGLSGVSKLFSAGIYVVLTPVYSNLHPTIAGHQKIAGLFETWLKNFGIKPQSTWATPLL